MAFPTGQTQLGEDTEWPEIAAVAGSLLRQRIYSQGRLVGLRLEVPGIGTREFVGESGRQVVIWILNDLLREKAERRRRAAARRRV